MREFLLFSQAVDVKPGLFRTNQTWFDVNGVVKVNFNDVYWLSMTCENKRNSRKHDVREIFLKTRPQMSDDYDFITSARDDASNWRQNDEILYSYS